MQSESLPEKCVMHGSWCNVLLSGTQYIFNKEEIVVILYLLVLMCDSLLSFKSTILGTLGIYLLGMVQLAFKDGRPFWDKAEITSNGHCKSSFGSPNESAFLMTFFYPYIMIQFLFKYAPRPPYFLNFIFMLLLIVLWGLVYFQGLVNGTSYIYQCVIGQILGFIYLVGCMTFDEEIHKYCEKTGFVIRTSRSRKFYLFFFVLFLITLETILYMTQQNSWSMPQDWIVNAYYHSPHCKTYFATQTNYNLGLQSTYTTSGGLYVLIGAIFGQTYTLEYVKPLLWIYTPFWKKLLRTIIAIIPVFVLLYFLSPLFGQMNVPANIYILSSIVLNLACSFFIFGLFPIFCWKIGLVITEKEFQEKHPDFFRESPTEAETKGKPTQDEEAF